jgi:hypothetical protein
VATLQTIAVGATTHLTITVLTVDGHAPQPGKPGSSGPVTATARLGSLITWQIGLSGSPADVAASYNPTLQDVVGSVPQGHLDGRTFVWTHVDPASTRLLTVTTRIRGQAGCKTTVPLSVSVPGGAAVQAAVTISCPGGQPRPAGPVVVRSSIAAAAVAAGAVSVVSGTNLTVGAGATAITQSVVITVPAGALTETAGLLVMPVVSPLAAYLSADETGKAGLGLPGSPGYQLLAMDGTGTVIRDLNQPMTLCLSYAGLDLANLTPADLRISYHDPITRDFVALPSVLDQQSRTVCAQVVHFTVFQLIARAPAASTARAAARLASAEAVRLLTGTAKPSAAAQVQARSIAAGVQSALSVTTTGTLVFALPHTVPQGGSLLLGLRSLGSGESVTYDVRYTKGPVVHLEAATNTSGYNLVRLVVPRPAVRATAKDQLLPATVAIRVTHVNGTVEKRTVSFTVLVPKRK